MKSKPNKPFGHSQDFITHWFISLNCLIGKEHVDWEYLQPDIPELIESEYCNQN